MISRFEIVSFHSNLLRAILPVPFRSVPPSVPLVLDPSSARTGGLLPYVFEPPAERTSTGIRTRVPERDWTVTLSRSRRRAAPPQQTKSLWRGGGGSGCYYCCCCCCVLCFVAVVKRQF